MRRSLILILFLVVPIALGTVATLASRPYKAASSSASGGSPACLEVTRTTWYGFPIPWFVAGDTEILWTASCTILVYGGGPFGEVVEGAFLLDVLIYMVLYYASILAYIRIRRAVFTRMHLRFDARKA